MERQKEMELYDLKQKKGRGKEKQETGLPSGSNVEEFNPADIARTMRAFVHKVSSYKGAEAPEDRNKEVDIDVDQFIKDMESIMKQHGDEGANSDIEGGSSSDLDFRKMILMRVIWLNLPRIMGMDRILFCSPILML